MWEYILKADYDFVFEKDADWLGLYNFQDDKITVNLPVIVTKVRDQVRTSEDKPGYQFERNLGTKDESRIDTRMERQIIAEIIDTLEHESIHEATTEGVREHIMEYSKKTQDEIREEVENNPELAGARIPPIEDIFNTYKKIYYNLYQEYIVRMLQGKMEKSEILNVLARYVDSQRDMMKEQVNMAVFATMLGGDGDFDSDDIPNLMRAVQGHIAKLNEKFIIMIFDHQNKLDNAMLNSLNVAVEGNIDRVGNDEMARRMRWGAENQEEENNNE